jgi:hypothetical protein
MNGIDLGIYIIKNENQLQNYKQNAQAYTLITNTSIVDIKQRLDVDCQKLYRSVNGDVIYENVGQRYWSKISLKGDFDLSEHLTIGTNILVECLQRFTVKVTNSEMTVERAVVDGSAIVFNKIDEKITCVKSNGKVISLNQENVSNNEEFWYVSYRPKILMIVTKLSVEKNQLGVVNYIEIESFEQSFTL